MNITITEAKRHRTRATPLDLPMPSETRARKAAEYVTLFSQDEIDRLASFFETDIGRRVIIERKWVFDDAVVLTAAAERGASIIKARDVFLSDLDAALATFPLPKTSQDLTAEDKARLKTLMSNTGGKTEK